MFFDNLEKCKNNVALFLSKNEKIFYKDILNISNEFKKKIKQRSLSLLISENCLESLCGYVSLLRSNNPVMILDPDTTKNDLQVIINKFEPQYVFCSKKNQIKIPKNLFNSIYSFRNFNLFEYKKKNSYQINEKLMLLLSTSGSLGEPKFVKLSLENMKSNTKSIISYLNLNSTDRSITTMPMSYSYGLSIINSHLISGASVIINNYSLVDKNFWKLYDQIKPSNVNGVPFFYEIFNKIGFERILENKPRFITQAGGRIKNKIFNKIANICLQNDISFYLMYGQTEASPRISYHKVKTKDLKTEMIPIGKPIDGGEILLKDTNGSLIDKANVEGELIYKGKNIFGGYAENYYDLNSFDNISELRTGDLALKDKNEIFFIAGRKGRFVKIYGYRINLDYIEEKINSNNYSVACIAVDEKIYIFSKNKNLNLENIANLPKKTYEIIILKEFPINNNGKISYSKLTKLVNNKEIN